MEVKNKSSRRQIILSLQALRALAFLGIFCHHAEVIKLDLGAWGVSVFFVLSGFLMIYQYWDSDKIVSISKSFKFGLLKIRKLYILHIITMLAVVIQNYVHDSIINQQGGGYGVKIFFNMFLLQAWSPSEDIYWSLNGVSWYLSACMFIYMAFPVIYCCIKKIKDDNIFLIMIGIYAVMFVAAWLSSFVNFDGYIANDFSKWLTYICPMFRLGDFITGCCLGYYYIMKKKIVKRRLAVILEILLFMCIIFENMISRGYISVGFLGDVWFRSTLLYLPSSLMLVYLFSIKKGILSQLFTNRVLIFIGNISPYAFLIHAIAIKISRAIVKRGFHVENIYIAAAVAFLGTIIASILWMKVTEKLLKQLNNIAKRG